VLRWYRVRAVRGLVRKLAHKKPQLLHKFFVTSAIKSVRRDAAAWPRINLVLLAAHASWRALPPWSRAAWSCRISDVSLVVVARCLLLPPPASSCLLLPPAPAPAEWAQLDDHKADVKGANALLIKELYAALGDSMLTSNPRLPVAPPAPRLTLVFLAADAPLVLAPWRLAPPRRCHCGQPCVARLVGDAWKMCGGGSRSGR